MTRRLIVLAALLAVGGCALDKQNAPGLTGPSELGLSLTLTATPDIVSWDGVSQARIEIVARDANSQPVPGLSMRVETGGLNTDGSVVAADIGTLSARTVVTNNDGRAAVTFTAPPKPPPTVGNDALVTVIVTPVGSNYQNTVARTVALRLARPGVILPPNIGAPDASFIFSPATPRQGDRVQFDASASTDDGQIVSFEWSFGDGDTGSGVRTSHTFDDSGTFTVVLAATDDRGLTSSVTREITVTQTVDPTAEFSVSPLNPVAGQQVHVNGSLSKASAGHVIVRYEWDFGDGSEIAQGVTASHTYDTPGNYVITLVVTDSLGKTDATTADVTVASSGPTAAFTVTPQSPMVGEVAAFNASGSTALAGRTITSYQWDFGDGTTGQNVTVSKAYAATGTYTVTLLVTDSAGQTGTISRTITITP